MNSTATGDDFSHLESKHVLLLTLLRLSHGDPINSLTKVQKLVFLAQQGGFESDPISDPIKSYFDFRAEKYGPYSQELTDTLDELVEEGLIERQESETAGRAEYAYSIEKRGHQAVKRRREAVSIDELRTLKLSKRLYNSMPTAQLLDKVYDAFPNYEGTR